MSSLESLIQPFKDIIRHNQSMIPNVLQILVDENPDLYTRAEYEQAINDFVSNDVLISSQKPVVVQEVVESVKTPMKPVFTPTKPVSKTPRPQINTGRYVALSRTRHQRVLKVITEIDNVVQRCPEGITKTDLLRRIRKDNSHWRDEVTGYLQDMVDDGVIQWDGRRYFPHNVILRARERNLHRSLYEIIGTGPKTLTNLYAQTGCNGGRNRSFVREALADLEAEGYISHEDRRWKWA